MSNSSEVLVIAQNRAQNNQLPYAGALTPEEAYQVLQQNSDALLIDVRTKAELELVGRVPGAINVEWAFYPGMVLNENFAHQLEAELDNRNAKRDTVLIFLCRTGGRSNNAASVAAALGYTQAYNTLQGFEGEANEHKQRTLINGWKHAGLPWTN